MKASLCAIKAPSFWPAPLVKAATGEEVSAEDLGGGDTHTRISGVADHLAENDTHALEIARKCINHLNRHKAASIPLKAPEEPLYAPEDIYGVIPQDLKTPSMCAISSPILWMAPNLTSSKTLRHHAGHGLCPYPRHACGDCGQ